MSMKCFPHWTFLQPLTYAWLKVGHSKVCRDNYKMLCEIMGLGGIYQLSLGRHCQNLGCPKNPKTFQALIVISNYKFEISKFKVF